MTSCVGAGPVPALGTGAVLRSVAFATSGAWPDEADGPAVDAGDSEEAVSVVGEDVDDVDFDDELPHAVTSSAKARAAAVDRALSMGRQGNSTRGGAVPDGFGWLSDMVIAVFAADESAGAELAAGLAELGALISLGALTDGARLDGDPAAVNGVVIAPFGRRDPVPVVDVREPVWEAGCDLVIKQALAATQAAYRAMSSTGGRLVFVVPIEAMTGGVGRVAEATAAEAIRSLAKSAARAWGRDGVTANCVAVPMSVLVGGSPSAPPAGWALGRPPGWSDVASAVAMLLADTSSFVTGTTVCVDGGDVMTP